MRTPAMSRRPALYTVLVLTIGLAPAVASAGEGERVLARGQVNLPNTLGEPVEVRKVVTPEGRIELRSSSTELGSWDDFEALRQKERATLEARYGNLTPGLHATFDALEAGEELRVDLVLLRPAVRHLDKYEYGAEELRSHSRALLNQRPVLDRDVLLRQYGLAEEALSPLGEYDDGTLRVRVDRRTLVRLMRDPAIAAIEPVMDDEPTTYAYSSYNESAFHVWSTLPYGVDGSGVHAGTFESHVHPDNTSCMGVDPANVDLDAGASRVDHSNITFKAMWNSARGIDAYHRNSWNYETTSSQAWIVANDVQSLSQSTTYYSGTTTTNRSRVMDDFSYRAPFTMFSNPTANGGHSMVAHWPHYNGLSVGNVRHLEERFFVIESCTQTTNPAPIYGSAISGSAGDREMPNVVTPGIHPFPSTARATDDCLPDFNLWCGTSISAPVTNGIVADVISADARMVDSTEAVKAAILVTARNVDGGYWNASEDGRDGAGTISGTDAVWFARNHTSVSPGGQAVHGMAKGSLDDTDKGDVFTFDIRTPFVKPVGKHLRVALVWTSNPSLTSAVNELSDLDLIVKNKSTGVVLGTSASFDDNVEIIEIDADALSTNTLYTVELNVTDTRIPTSATASFFYYALAWTWVQDIYAEIPERGGYALGVSGSSCTTGTTKTLLDNSARQYCRELGNGSYHLHYDVDGPKGGVHSWWNGSSWSTSGNSNVCYIENLSCQTQNVPYYPEPAPVYRIGVNWPSYCTTNTTLNNSAAAYCQEAGYDTYATYGLDGPMGGVYSWWNGSSWSTTGNSNVCYIRSLVCRNF
ncbi:MAG: hypothetical protein AAGD06_11260 [Acidobacteriota bacterium]